MNIPRSKNALIAALASIYYLQANTAIEKTDVLVFIFASFFAALPETHTSSEVNRSTVVKMSPSCSPSSSSFVFVLLSIFVFLSAVLSSSSSMVEAKTVMLGPGGGEREIRADGGEGEMTDALKYLEELDKYYSQVARPR